MGAADGGFEIHDHTPTKQPPERPWPCDESFAYIASKDGRPRGDSPSRPTYKCSDPLPRFRNSIWDNKYAIYGHYEGLRRDCASNDE